MSHEQKLCDQRCGDSTSGWSAWHTHTRTHITTGFLRSRIFERRARKNGRSFIGTYCWRISVADFVTLRRYDAMSLQTGYENSIELWSVPFLIIGNFCQCRVFQITYANSSTYATLKTLQSTKTCSALASFHKVSAWITASTFALYKFPIVWLYLVNLFDSKFRVCSCIILARY